MNKTFAQYVRELRNKKGMTVYDLAEKIGKTPGYISKIEARGEIPSPDLIIQLAKSLGVEPEELAKVAKKQKADDFAKDVSKKYDDVISLYRKSGKNQNA